MYKAIRIPKAMIKNFQRVKTFLSGGRRKPFSISLIEDNQIYLHTIVQNIKTNVPNIKLNAFSRSSSFLNSLRHKPEIAIVDLNLDERSEIEGIELIRELKFKSPNTRIIVLTGEQSISTAVKCLNEGVMDYIIKEDKAIDKIALEVKELMKEMLAEMQKEARQRRLHLIIGTIAIIAIGIFVMNSIDPTLLE